MRYIHGDGHVRVYAIGARLGTAKANLFLHSRGHKQGAGQGAHRRRPTKCLQHNPKSDFVVHRGRAGQTAPQLLELELHRDWVANAHHALGIRLVWGTDVNPKVLHLGYDFSLLLGEQVNRLSRNHSRNCARRGPDTHARADQLHGIPTTNWLYGNIAIRIDVLNDQPNLIAVASQQHAHRRRKI